MCFDVVLQILSNRKGLLPEPNLAQLLTSMTNPAALQILMRPHHGGKRGGNALRLSRSVRRKIRKKYLVALEFVHAVSELGSSTLLICNTLDLKQYNKT